MAVKEKRQPRRKLVHSQAGVQPGLHVSDAVGEGERQFLHRGRPGFPNMVAADADDVPARQLACPESQHILDQPHARPRRDDPFFLGDELLQHIRLGRPAQLIAPVPGTFRGHQVHRQQDVGGRVDRHRGGDTIQRQAAEQDFHVLQRIDRHALPAHLPLRPCVVGVVAHQRRHVKRHRQPRLPMLQKIMEAPVAVLRRPKAGELPHRPQPPSIHCRMDAARKRILAGQSQIAGRIVRRQVVRGIQARDLHIRERGKSRSAFGLLLQTAPQRRRLPLPAGLTQLFKLLGIDHHASVLALRLPHCLC